jgi:pilus assembly protein CpaB
LAQSNKSRTGANATNLKRSEALAPNISSSAKDSEMSSTLRLSIIAVLLLSTTALGLIAYRSMNPQVQIPDIPAPFTPAPSKEGYFVATKPLRIGTLAKEDDFKFKPLTPGIVAPPDVTIEAPDAIARLRGSLVRRFLDTESPVTSKDILRPQDRGFLASVLEAGSVPSVSRLMRSLASRV